MISSKFSIVFVYKYDVPRRFVNLSTVLNYYSPLSDDIIVVCDKDSHTEEVDNIINKHNIKLLVEDNYKKTKFDNLGIAEAKHDIVFICDIDSILEHSNIIAAVDELSQNLNIGIIYPYNKLFVNVNVDIVDKFIKTLDINTFKDNVQFSTFAVGSEANGMDIVHNNSVGGGLILSKSNLSQAGGYNINIDGWAFDDTEIYERYKRLGYDVASSTRSDAYLFHMEHPGTVRMECPHFNTSNQINSNVCRMGRVELLAYIASWNSFK